MIQPLRLAAVSAPVLAAVTWVLLRSPAPALAALVIGFSTVTALLVLAGLRVAAPWEQAVIFRRGRPVGLRGPGLYAVVPLLEEPVLVDGRLRALDLGRRRLLTLDRKAVWIEAALFFQVDDPVRALLACRDLDEVLARVGQASLLAVTSRCLLSSLSNRHEVVENDLEAEVSRRARDLGVRFDRFRLLTVEPAEPLQCQPSVEDVTPSCLTPCEPRPGVVHGLEALRRGPAGEVVQFSADLGRQLPRPGDKLSD
jgi:regulator of protease activity HflC (stomatin/prohibitin superfamily)